MKSLLFAVLLSSSVLLAPAASACYHDATIREQEQEFESGYDPALQPPLPEVEEAAPEGIAQVDMVEEQIAPAKIQLGGLGALALGSILIGNLLLLARRRLG